MADRIHLIAAAAVLTVTVTLTACSGLPGQSLDLGKPAASQSTPAPTAKGYTSGADAAAGLEIGAELTEEQATAIRKDFKGDDIAYAMSDGTRVLISRAAPLPKNVKADIGAEVISHFDTNSQSGNYEAIDAIMSARSETGRKIVAVTQMLDNPAPAVFNTVWVATSGNGGTGTNYKSKGEAYTAAEQYVADQDNPEDWDIVAP